MPIGTNLQPKKPHRKSIRSNKPQGQSKPQRGPTAPQRPWKKPAVYFIIIFLISSGYTILFITSNLDKTWPYSIFYYGDTSHYHRYASTILQGGELYDHGIPYHPPMFAWYLSGVYRLMGPPVKNGFPYKMWMLSLVALAIALTWLWWRRILTPPWTLAALLALGTHFGFLVFGASFNNEALYILFLTTTLGLVITWGPRFPFALAPGLGLVMAAGSLTRAEHAILWPFILVYLFILREPSLSLRAWTIRSLVAVIIFLVCILPWTLRNAHYLRAYNRSIPGLEPLPTWVPITSYGPVNFALANNDTADGGFRPDLLVSYGSQGSINLENPQQRAIYIHGYSIGWHWMVSNPGRALSLLLKKLNRWLDGLRLGFGLKNFPSGLSGVRYPVDMFIPDRTALKWPLTVLLTLGMALTLKKTFQPLLILTFLILHRALVTILFFGYARGFVILLPAALPLILLPFIAIGTAPKYRKYTRYIPFILISGFVIIIFSDIITAQQGPRNYMASGSVNPVTGKIIQDDTVRLWLIKNPSQGSP